MRERNIRQNGEYKPLWSYALQSPAKAEQDDNDDDDDDDIENDFEELPRELSYSSMDRDGYSRHYGSTQISNGVGGSAVSSPAEESPEALYRPYRPRVFNSSYSGDDSKLRKPQVRYWECQKNHAASMGGHAVDGCGEFLPSGKEGTLEALICAACSCHRNFHRRAFLGNDGLCVCGAVERSGSLSRPYSVNQSLRPMSPGVRETRVSQLPSSTDISPHNQIIVAPLAQYNDEDDEDDDEPPQNPRGGSSKKKRFRTKFTPEQKERMMDFAASLRWRISKHDEEAVQQFCKDVNVKRNVFKVWMHNNKARKLNGADFGGNCDSPLDY